MQGTTPDVERSGKIAAKFRRGEARLREVIRRWESR
jgi:hypothetical protein